MCCYILDCRAMDDKQDGQNSYSLGSHSLLLGPPRPFWEGRQGQGYLHNIPPLVHICPDDKSQPHGGHHGWDPGTNQGGHHAVGASFSPHHALQLKKH